MRRVSYFALIFAVALAAVIPAVAYAQSDRAISQNSLSPTDRAAVASILDALETQKGDILNQSVVRALDSSGGDPQAIVRAVKVAAGGNLPNFQSILVRACLGGGAIYCKLASLQAPSPQDSDIKTAATDSGEGGAGGGGFGGTLQLNQGHNSGSFASGSLFDAAGLNESFNFGQSFAASSGTGGGTSTTVTAETLSVPGPVAGAGLPVLATFLAWLLRRRRGGFFQSNIERTFGCAVTPDIPPFEARG